MVIDASASSQFVSGLLLSGARYEKGVTVVHDGKPVPSLPHIDMSVDMLRTAGVEVDDADANTWRVAPGPIAPRDWTVEPDLSNAAVFLAAAAVTGGEVTVAGWPERSTQPGVAILPVLEQFGATVGPTAGGMAVRGPDTLRGVDVDLHDVGELTPTIAAVAALATTPSRLRGVAHLRGHETDRLAALATELAALGGDVEETADGLLIRPAPLRAGDRPWRAYADHRMATAGALVGLVVPGCPDRRHGEHRQDHPRFPRPVGRPRGGVNRSPASTTSPTSGCGPDAARAPGASAGRATPTRSRRWSPRSTAAAGPAHRTATPPANP